VLCEQSYYGDTTGYPALIRDYGCVAGMVGPEVVYALQVGYKLEYLSITLDTSVDQWLFLLSSASPDTCLTWGGSVVLPNVAPGTYYIVVDGIAAGAYYMQVSCYPPPQNTPTPTRTATKTPTAGPSPTATVTPTRTPVGFSEVYLPIIAKATLEFYVDCGASGDYIDTQGRRWHADREWTAGGWGYVGNTKLYSSGNAILGTDDDLLYQTQRYCEAGRFAYRFDVPFGTYKIELHFAELYPQITKPGQRVFDVVIEEQTVLDDVDIFAQAPGSFRALVRRVTMDVTDGQINVRFDPTTGDAVVNAIRVTKVAASQ